MQEWLTVIAGHAITGMHAMALVVVVFGTVQAAVRSFRAMVKPSATGTHFQTGYIHYARWLVAGLTFQLAADIIETAFSPSWDEIGRLAAIAVIRTFVNFFLERDLAELERRESESEGALHKLS
jgi:uncharacterized membrane protein